MEYVKDEIFNIRYNERLDKLEIGRKNRGDRFKDFIYSHKLITFSVIAFFFFSAFDIFLVYQFVRIFETL